MRFGVQGSRVAQLAAYRLHRSALYESPPPEGLPRPKRGARGGFLLGMREEWHAVLTTRALSLVPYYYKNAGNIILI